MRKTTQYYVEVYSKSVCSPLRVSKTILLCRSAKQDRIITWFKKEYNSLLRQSPEQRIIDV
jgi:hypothetical protein